MLALRRSASHSASLDGALVAVAIVLTLGAAASDVLPVLDARVVAPSLDLVLDTVTTMMTLSVAALCWVRFRRSGEPIALLQSAAFLVLAIAGGLLLLLVTTGFDRQAGMALVARGQAPLYDASVARVFAAALLVMGGVTSLRAGRLPHALGIVLGSALGMLLIVALLQVAADRLPALGSIGGPELPSPMPLGTAIALLGAALFLWAALLSRRLYRRDGSIGDAYLAVGLVVAAFAQVANAAYPGTYTGIVTSGDALGLAFDVILLLGIQAEAGALMTRVRLANEDLARLHGVEVERAALEERSRLSRELHDGLAQDLWLAKLKAGRLAALPGLGLEARALTAELDEAIDAGLAEAHQAVAAMRLFDEPTGSLSDLLSRCVDDFADRFGMRIEFTCEPSLPTLPRRAQAEALRIVQEALTNVRRHADATVVRVRASMEDGRIVVAVGDNGCGFDPDVVGEAAFGLASMQERAALLGAELRIETRPQDGTRVSLRMPKTIALTPIGAGSV
jgi:signal transduction histidine kinase